jgi:Arc/MetJ family transcription regulator
MVALSCSVCGLRDFGGTLLCIKWCYYSSSSSGDPMRTTVTLDDDLLAKAMKLTGGLDRSTVLREGLKALIERESALRLAKLGGTQPQLRSVPRRRSAAVR